MYRELGQGLSTAQRLLRDDAHRFAVEVLRPTATALDRMADPNAVVARGSPLWTALRHAYQLGYHGVMIPAELGGLGLSGFEQHLLLEELGWGSADLAMSVVLSGLPFAMTACEGSTELVELLVRPFVRDTAVRFVGCWAVTEPDHGSDALMVGAREFHTSRITGDLIARPDRDCYVLSGRKSAWVANGSIATHALTFLSLDPSMGMAGGGVLVVPLHLHGITRGRPVDKLGQRALNQGEIVFDEVRVPATHLLADPGRYEHVVDRTLCRLSAATSAIFTGLARAAYEAAFARCRQRVQGGRPLCEHQLVQKRLFDMFTAVEACRALSRAAMIQSHAPSPAGTEYSIAAKTFCTQSALDVASSALQLFGGDGLRRGDPIEKIFRDARTSIVEHGSNDVLALVGMQRIITRNKTPPGVRTAA